MPRVKNQHTVPRSYLRRFTVERDKIWVFDKVTSRSFPTNVKNVASGMGFYDFDSVVLQALEEQFEDAPLSELPLEARKVILDPNMVERELAEMESGYVITIDELLQQVESNGAFTQDIKERMAYYLTKQFLRTSTFRATHLESANKLLQDVSQMLVATKFGTQAADDIVVSMDEKYIAYEHARMMYDPTLNQTFIAALLGHIWHIGINDTGRPLYTSDNPIIMRSHLASPSYGIASPGIEIMVPLTPRHILVLAERRYFAHLAPLDRCALPLEPGNVVYFNSGQVLASYRQIYCSRSDFELAVDVCATHPHVCDPNRERIQMFGGFGSWRKQREGHDTSD